MTQDVLRFVKKLTGSKLTETPIPSVYEYCGVRPLHVLCYGVCLLTELPTQFTKLLPRISDVIILMKKLSKYFIFGKIIFCHEKVWALLVDEFNSECSVRTRLIV